MLAFCSIVAGSLLCWTHPLPGNLSSGNIPKRLLPYMPIVHVSYTGNLFAHCQSVHQGYKAEDPGPRSSPDSGLLNGMVCLRTDIGSVLVLLMEVRNTTPIWKGKPKKDAGKQQGQINFLVWTNQVWIGFGRIQFCSHETFILYFLMNKRTNIPPHPQPPYYCRRWTRKHILTLFSVTKNSSLV